MSSWQDPCIFPIIAADAPRDGSCGFSEVKLDDAILELELRNREIAELLPLVRASWSLVLNKFCEVDQVSFGLNLNAANIRSGASAETTGACHEASCASVSITPEMTLDELNRGANSRTLPIPSESSELFNTCLNIVITKPCVISDLLSLARPAGGKETKPSPDYVLQLQVKIHQDTIELALRYETHVLSEKQAHDVASTVQHAMICLIRAPGHTVGQTSLASKRNHDDIARWNDATISESRSLIHEIIYERCTEAPSSLAVRSWDGDFSYRELDSISDRIAAHLASLGVGADVFVPVCYEKSKWFVAAALAVLKTGGCYVPLDPSSPIKRIHGIIHEVNANIILTSSKTAELLHEVADRALILNETTFANLPNLRLELPQPTPGSAPGYALFTSGSTGVPKGCLVSHVAFASVASSHSEAVGIERDSRVLQFASVGFGMGLIEIFCTLTTGGTICIPSDSERNADLVGAINRLQATWAILTPSVIQTINHSEVQCLRTLAVAGEPLPRSLVPVWAARVQLIQAYGLTEWAGICAVSSALAPSTGNTNIGRPTNARFWLVEPGDPQKLVPVGAVGELLLEGPCLSYGYLNQPEQTTRGFIPPPSWRKTFQSPLASQRLYRTGDLLRYREDGCCDYIGRTGTQVKIRGQRVELGEVEYHTRQHFKHAKTVIAEMILPKGDKSPSLVAFVCLHPKDAPVKDVPYLAPPSDVFRASAQEAHASLSPILPRYMLPDLYVEMTRIPVTVSGKISRKDLRQMGGEKTREELNMYLAERKETRMPQTPLQRLLHEVFAKALNKDPASVGIDDNFFRLGGDSIIGMQACALCRKQKVTLTIQDIFRHRTIAELSKHIRIKDAGQAPELEALNLSAAQQAFLHSTNPDDRNRANQQLVIRLSGSADVDTVRYAVSDVVERHASLRSRFRLDSQGNWTQHTQKHGSTAFGFRAELIPDITAIPDLIAELEASLSIENGPLFTAALTESDNRDRHIILVAHCLVVDKPSWATICGDLEMVLDGQAQSLDSTPSFHSWCQTQKEQSPALDLLRHAANAHDGLDSVDDTVWEAKLDLDEQLSQTLVGKANHAFRTQPVDIFHGALRHACGKIPDAPATAYFLEIPSRGSSDVETSNMVGWLSTIIPANVMMGSGNQDIVDVIRGAKDARVRKGVSQHGGDKHDLNNDQSPHPLTVLLRFDTGDPLAGWQGKILEREDLFGNDIGVSASPLAKLEIVIGMVQDKVRLTFRSQRPALFTTVEQWVAQLDTSLQEAAVKLVNCDSGYTLADLALPSLSYEKLQEALPCAPMQQGILLSQARDPQTYQIQSIWKATPVRSLPAEQMLWRFRNAWRQVVERHGLLRTVLVESQLNEGGFDQVVLKSVAPRVDGICLPRGDPFAVVLRRNLEAEFSAEEPPHKLTICVTGHSIYLGLSISHALVDASSISILMRDLGLAYDGCLPKGQGPYFGKYLSYLQGLEIDQSAKFWASYLEDIRPCVLPQLDYWSPAVEYKRELKTVEFEMALVEDLERFCAQEGVTISNVFQLAWALVLRCYAETDDVCFGYLAAGRDIPVEGVEDAVGPYINMMITRVQFGSGHTLREELRKTLNNFIESCAHQHVPLSRILGPLNLAGPLFNTIISLRRPSSHGVTSASSLELDNIYEIDPTEFDLAANVHVSPKTVHVSISHWTSTLSTEQAQNFAFTLQKALSTILSHVDCAPEQLDLFSEQNHALVQRLNSQAPRRVDDCAHRLFNRQADVQPQAPAVCAWDGDLTYSELDRLSSLLATCLAQHGVGHETFVPIHCERSKWVLVAIIAVAKAGAAFVLLDPSHPPSRLRAICDDVRAAIIISSETLFPISEQFVPSVMVVGNNSSNATAFAAPDTSVRPSNALYAVFTSGSTGNPKGVVIEHSTFCTSAQAHGGIIALSPASRVLSFSSFAFDVCIAELLTTLCYGGCVCVPSEDERLNDLSGAINRLRVNTACITPTVLRILDAKQVPSLRTVVLAGEPIAQADVDAWAEQATLMNAFGPAECCIYCVIQPNIDSHSDPRNIGYGANCLPWVVDPNDHDRLAPVGTVGELLIEGPLVAREYLHQPEKTAEVFIQPPRWRSSFPVRQSGRLYKTGDLVRYGPKGTLRFVGRKGTQVKIHGQRLELADVEHHLRQHVGQSIDVLVDVVPFDGRVDHPTLTAFFKPRHGQGSAGLSAFMADLPSMVSSLKARLRSSLPQYMVPMAYIPLENFAVGKTHKTDRTKLRQLAIEMRQKEVATGGREEKRPPRTEAERKLQNLVATVLNLPTERVGLDDNFFMLGGDSAYAVRLVSLARQEALQLSVKDILRQPLLKDLVAHEEDNAASPSTSPNDNDEATEVPTAAAPSPYGLLDADDTDAFIDKVVAPKMGVPAEQIQDVLPTTDFQAECIIDWPLTYFLVTMHGALDKARLRAACQSLVERHEIYRTGYVRDGLHVRQVALKQMPVPLFEYTGNPEDDLDALCETVCRADSRRGLPLGHVPTQFTLFSHGDPNYHILALRFSHAQYDGFCLPLIFKDLAALYEDSGSLGPVTNFSAYIHHLASQGTADAQTFWQQTLKGCSPPTSLRHLSLGTPDHDRQDSLVELTREVGAPTPPATITIASLMKSATALLLMRLTSETDLVFGQVVSGRNTPLAGVESILGVCANIVPVRVQSHAKWTVLDLLQSVQAQHIDALDHETLGLGAIQRNCTAWQEGTKLGCLIQHQNLDLKPEFSLGEVECTTRIFGGEFKREFLHICTLPRGNRLVVQLFAPEGLLRPEACQRVLDQLCDTAAWLASHPHHLLAEYPNSVLAN
ncbi:Nonribosomal Peptide Synthase (NRPS) [Aspergillus melleus]|uniref:Nonribosomal Peptide Synthase (NRPS) n=1 Tax=Aspergillus melleus TaxID=138277 RepID=A0ACC3API9_9EURO|nr:Nonribosomal Peptide Synthase (NRPS) [Aspergillus melleus]